MPPRLSDYGLTFLYALAAISGLAGGCMVAAHRVLNGRKMTLPFLAAYGFAGLVFGLTGTIVLVLVTGWTPDAERSILIGLVFGAAGAISLAGMHLSARFILRRFGIEVDVEIKRIGEEPKK